MNGTALIGNEEGPFREVPVDVRWSLPWDRLEVWVQVEGQERIKVWIEPYAVLHIMLSMRSRRRQIRRAAKATGLSMPNRWPLFLQRPYYEWKWRRRMARVS